MICSNTRLLVQLLRVLLRRICAFVHMDRWYPKNSVQDLYIIPFLISRNNLLSSPKHITSTIRTHKLLHILLKQTTTTSFLDPQHSITMSPSIIQKRGGGGSFCTVQRGGGSFLTVQRGGGSFCTVQRGGGGSFCTIQRGGGSFCTVQRC
ncbi:hypothetical protein BKA65DRAFT_499113 [Rhexocercosporidium sp. MPI-PUGE-AT-0058]|nr:hypothetical protein BKA65DRAFT_499113 [Rhexocercosporidium sp. MPI-PUGE-AT-0058]